MRFPSPAPWSHRFRRSPALLVAFVALLAGGLTQASWAVSQITGGGIRDGSLTGKDVKDGSLGPSDLSRKARAVLRGQTGVAGPIGATGPVGPAGVTGPSGPSGPVGGAGPQGATGARGPVGPAGAPGLVGETGPTGETGPRGAQGAKGEKGDQGAKGEPGEPAVEHWAAVKLSGDVVAASAPEPTVAALGHGAGRVYRVTWARSIRNCAASVTRQSQRVNDPDDATPISTVDEELGGSAYTYFGAAVTELFVRLLDRSGYGTEGAFSVSLQCADEPALAPPDLH